MDPGTLWPALLDIHLWVIVVGVAALGALGAAIRPPEPGAVTEPRRKWDVLAGSVAAVAVLYATEPASASALIGGSLVAGFAASAVLGGLQAKLIAAVSTREAAEHSRIAREHQIVAEAEARRATENAKAALQARKEFDQLADAAERGADLVPVVRGLRAQRTGALDAG